METEVFKRLLQPLPPSIQHQVLAYRKWQDQQRCLLGKILLRTGLSSFFSLSYELDNLKYTKFQRPFIDNAVDFNITHANDFTLCAISQTTRVGIDIEKMQPTDVTLFKDYFSAPEWRQLSLAQNRLHAFYRLWTQKEAFLKAIGKGLTVPLNSVTVENNCILWDSGRWYLHEITLHNEYSCHLCVSSLSTPIVTKEIQLLPGIGFSD